MSFIEEKQRRRWNFFSKILCLSQLSNILGVSRIPIPMRVCGIILGYKESEIKLI